MNWMEMIVKQFALLDLLICNLVRIFSEASSVYRTAIWYYLLKNGLDNKYMGDILN